MHRNCNASRACHETPPCRALRVDPELRRSRRNVLQEGEACRASSRHRCARPSCGAASVPSSSRAGTGLARGSQTVPAHTSLPRWCTRNGQEAGPGGRAAEGPRVSFVVRYSVTAKDDLARLYDHPLDRATTLEDLDLAERALAAIAAAVEACAARRSSTARLATIRFCASCSSPSDTAAAWRCSRSKTRRR